MAKIVSIKTSAKHVGNIPELEELETVTQLRILIHHRLREWLARKRRFKDLAVKAHLNPNTVSRAAYNVSQRTTIGTIYKLAPWLGIRLDATLDKDW